MYRKMTIYYLTGTGNSFCVASWMAEQAVSQCIDAKAIAAEVAQPECELQDGENGLLGIVFPVHGFTAPWHVIRFAMALPRRAGIHAFVAVPRGATKFGKSAIFPGMEGTAGYLIALILVFKGYTMRGVTGIDMPSNWMSLHSALSPANVDFVIEKAKKQAGRMIRSVLSGKAYFNGILCLVIGLLLLPLSILYLALGRFCLSKLFFASNACTGCGLCVRNCPIGAVVLKGCDKPRPYWTFSCESCMRCMGYCPEKAVEVSHSLGAILYFFTAIPVSTWLLTKIAVFLPGNDWVQGDWLQQVAWYLDVLLAMWLSYWIFHWLIRIPLINDLFTWTTLTHLYDRYHAPGTDLDVFKK